MSNIEKTEVGTERKDAVNSNNLVLPTAPRVFQVKNSSQGYTYFDPADPYTAKKIAQIYKALVQAKVSSDEFAISAPAVIHNQTLDTTTEELLSFEVSLKRVGEKSVRLVLTSCKEKEAHTTQEISTAETVNLSTANTTVDIPVSQIKKPLSKEEANEEAQKRFKEEMARKLTEEKAADTSSAAEKILRNMHRRR